MTREQHDALYEEYCQDAYKVNKYKRPGIYCIKINDQIVYIGKSIDMLNRLAAHTLEIIEGKSANKYKVLHQAMQREDCQIQFDVLYVSNFNSNDSIKRDIGKAEARLINEHRPALNYQIPSLGDYMHYTVNKKAKYITLNEILHPELESFDF